MLITFFAFFGSFAPLSIIIIIMDVPVARSSSSSSSSSFSLSERDSGSLVFIQLFQAPTLSVRSNTTFYHSAPKMVLISLYRCLRAASLFNSSNTYALIDGLY